MQTKNVINHKVILNLIQDLPRLPLPLLNNLQSRCQDPVLKHYGAGKKEISRFGMTALFDKGFTLIELLVVVLIIGILTAVAVPQYQKAVLKSRFGTLMPLAKNLWDSNEVFYLNNGIYADSTDELDVSAPADPNAQVTIGNTDRHAYIKLTRNDIQNNLIAYQTHSPNFPGETHCEALAQDTYANWLCKEGLRGRFVKRALSEGYNTYVLEGPGNGNFGKTYYNPGNNAGLSLEEGDICVGTGYINDNCKNIQATDGAVCEAQNHSACNGSSFTNQSVCNGNGSYSCAASFSDSECISNSSYACGGSTFSSSTCTGNTDWSCYNSSFSSSTCEAKGWMSCTEGQFTQSVCIGRSSTGCARNSTFTDHSICYAYVNGACDGSTYDDTSYCAGTNCPKGVPHREWNETTQAYDIPGWKGNCCKPAYMANGECPSGVTVCS